MDTIQIYTDGACSGNPGPGGWGALLRTGSHQKEIWGGELSTTNNRMELLAVIEALRILKRRCNVELYTDSQYVQKGMLSWMANWKKRQWRTASNSPVKNSDLWKQLDVLSEQHQIAWKWVKGHAGHPENEKADELARRGVAQVKQAGRNVISEHSDRQDQNS